MENPSDMGKLFSDSKTCCFWALILVQIALKAIYLTEVSGSCTAYRATLQLPTCSIFTFGSWGKSQKTNCKGSKTNHNLGKW